MVSNFTNLAITWYDESDGYATSASVLTNGTVIALPVWTDTGSGEVNEFEMVLSAKGGNFITSGTIQFDKHDRISIALDDLASNSYLRFFEITDIIPSQTKSEGTILTLRGLGIEYHTQLIHYARRSWFKTSAHVAEKIGDAYGGNPNVGNRGSRQPVIQRYNDSSYSTSNKYGNGLPRFTSNHYEFGASEDTCYNRWMDLVDLLGGGVGSGGVGDFFDLSFETPSVNAIDFACFVSGARSIDGNDVTNDASLVQIENTASINVSEQEGGISNPTGTKVLAWGSSTHGSLPVGTAKYRGGELEFSYRPEWASGVDYKIDAKVLWTNGKHYKATSDHTSSGSNEPTDGGAPWAVIDFSSEFGDTQQYSEWTDDKAKLWANAGANPEGVSALSAWATPTTYTIGDLVTESSKEYVCIIKHISATFATDLTNLNWEQTDNSLEGNGAAFFDCNTVARDNGRYFRTWVTEAIGDEDYNSVTDMTAHINYLHSNNQWAVGHRMLNVNDTELSGNDIHGRPFKDAVVEWRGSRTNTESAQWEVMYNPSSTTDRMHVFEIKEKKIWEWQNGISRWVDITTEGGTGTQNDDCAHQWKSLYNIKGSDSRPTQQNTTPFNEDSNDFAKNVRSALEVCYAFGVVDQKFFKTGADYKKGAWLTFGFPFPVSVFNSISEGVGDIFGGGTNEAIPTNPSLLDIENMTWTSDGKIGFNHSTSEGLGNLQSMAFNMRILMYTVEPRLAGGIATVRCTMFDIKDNVVVQDFEHRFTSFDDYWQSVNLPLSGFTPYRGRMPFNHAERGFSALGLTIPINELDINDVFEFQNIKHISFQIQNFYDDEGRYNPEQNMFEVDNAGVMTLAGGFIRMAVDSFHFKKTLLASTGQPSTINIEPTFLQRPNIISFNQLLNEANAQLEIEQFRHKEFNFQTSGNSLFDIRFGDTFFLKNTELISDANNGETSINADDGTAGTIRLVAKRIEYHMTKPRAGPGGITRSIKGVKRFST